MCLLSTFYLPHKSFKKFKNSLIGQGFYFRTLILLKKIHNKTYCNKVYRYKFMFYAKKYNIKYNISRLQTVFCSYIPELCIKSHHNV